jgi:adenylate cyclase
MASAGPDDRLTSWKEIAAHLRTSVRTVQRWEEKEGLPVHRHQHDKGGSVFALRSELDSWRSGRAHGPHEPAAAVSIAVLPFTNLTGDNENDYFSDGLAEDILNSLARVTGLRVVARRSSFAFRGGNQDLRKIGEALNVSAILEGRVRRSGDRVRVTAELVNVSDGFQLWSERYDREMRDVFAIQDDISESIVTALRTRLGSESKAHRRRPTSPHAYHAFLRGRHLLNAWTRDGISRARNFFEEAIALDPAYAPAYVGLAEHYWGLANFDLGAPLEVMPQARQAARQALDLDPENAEAHCLLGVAAAALDYDWRSSEGHFRRALSQSGVPPFVRIRYCNDFLIPQRRTQEALAAILLAEESDPVDAYVAGVTAHVRYCAGEYDLALETCRRSLELDDKWWLAHWLKGNVYRQLEMTRESIESLERSLDLAPWSPWVIGLLAGMYVKSGQRPRGEELLRNFGEAHSGSFLSPVLSALYYGAAGEHGRALDQLWELSRVRSLHAPRMAGDPAWRPFYGNSRFRALLESMNLA